MKRSSFTLVELLTVIAIICILAGMLLPAIGRARVTAVTTQCMNNMGQLGKAEAMFAVDHKNMISPACDLGTNYYSYPAALYEYVGKEAEAFKCPDDELEASTALDITYDTGKSFKLSRLSFLPNRNLHKATNDSKNYKRSSTVNSPSKMMSLAENGSYASAGTPGVYFYDNASDSSNYNEKCWNLRAHGDSRSNYLYLDGHTETIDGREADSKLDKDYAERLKAKSKRDESLLCWTLIDD